MNILIVFCSFLASILLTDLVKKALIRRRLLDHPNERSSHIKPVPRGGGWAVLAVILPGLVVVACMQDSLTAHASLILGVLLLAAVSWIDDKKGVSAPARLSMHFLAACFGSLCFPESMTLFNDSLPFAVDRAIMIVGWTWFMNLYNFMDGIDGITGVETITIATGSCLLMSVIGHDDSFITTLTVLLTGASLGFLTHNWHPAKIFLGDVGSVPLGYLTGFCLLSLALQGHPVPALILPLYYLADSGITITKRALRGEKIWQAHRQHFYQQAARGAGRHDFIVLRVAVANAALIGAALLAVSMPLAGLGIAVVVVALLLWNMHKLGHAHSAP